MTDRLEYHTTNIIILSYLFYSIFSKLSFSLTFYFTPLFFWAIWIKYQTMWVINVVIFFLKKPTIFLNVFQHKLIIRTLEL